MDAGLHTELHGLDCSQCATNFEWSPCPLDVGPCIGISQFTGHLSNSFDDFTKEF